MKKVVITGGTGGVGKAAAIELAKKGFEVIIQGFNKSKGEKVLAEVKTQSGNDHVQLICADLSVLSGIQAFADEVSKRFDRIDVFVQSTGRLNSQRKVTADGYEEGFVINYLNRFMLNHLLFNQLSQGEGRIIIVGAPVLKNAQISFDDLQTENKYSLFKAIGQAQYGVHLHVMHFNEKHGGHPVINVIHPGLVSSGILDNLSGGMKFLFKIVTMLSGNSAEKSVDNVIHLATGELWANQGGYFFRKLGNLSHKEKISYDGDLAQKLYDESIRLCKLK